MTFKKGDKAIVITDYDLRTKKGEIVEIESGPVGQGMGGNYYTTDGRCILGDFLKLYKETSAPHWKKYINTRTAVLVKSEQELRTLLEFLEKNTDLRWTSGRNPTECISFRHLNHCVEIYKYLTQSPKEYFEEIGYTIISFEEFMGKEDKTLFTTKEEHCGRNVFTYEQMYGECPASISKRYHAIMMGRMCGKTNFYTEILERQIKDFNKPNIIKKTMSNIVKFAKYITLSADEKELRKAGLQDEDGGWTEEADDIIENFVAKEAGFKNSVEMSEKYGLGDDGDVLESALEWHTAYTKYADELLKIAKKYNKENKEK